jgi:hypothetical protein
MFGVLAEEALEPASGLFHPALNRVRQRGP